MIYVSAFFVSLIYVSLRAFQQLNIVHHKIKWVPVTSLFMGMCDVFLVATMFHSGFSFYVAIALGLGGAVGSIASMLLHKRMRK